MIFRSEVWDGKTVKARGINARVAHATQWQLADLPSIWTFWHICNDGIGKTWHHHVIWNRWQIGLSGLPSRLNHDNNSQTLLIHNQRKCLNYDAYLTFTSFLRGTGPRHGEEHEEKANSCHFVILNKDSCVSFAWLRLPKISLMT